MRVAPKILLLFIMLFYRTTSFAQSEKDKVEALRVSFISKKIELSASESEKFWPVYNEYNDKIKALRRSVRKSYVQRKDQLTDKDAADLYALDVQARQSELDLYKQYSERIKNIIGVKKLVLLHAAEDEFKREILNVLKDKGE